MIGQALTRDSVTVTVDAVVYFRIQNATVSVTNISDAPGSTKLLAQTTLRNMIGTKNMSEILMDREGLSAQMQVRGNRVRVIFVFFLMFFCFHKHYTPKIFCDLFCVFVSLVVP